MELKTAASPLPNQKVWKGWYDIDGKRMYLKSNWERRYCLYLSLMKKHGHVSDYWYEPDTFWFEGIKRGTNNYKPDFKVLFPSGKIEYFEVKGYEKSKDRTKYKRMAKYHPDVKLNIINKDWFKANGRTLKGLLSEW
jgi:hypothetical protein